MQNRSNSYNKKWKETGKEIVNPYNFIPLGVKCKRKEKQNRTEEKLTGKIMCELIPKTDIFIANTSNDNAFNTYSNLMKEDTRHKSYDFFSYTDLSQMKEKEKANVSQPVIPGSSIRGMIKNEYETLTDSCFVTDLNLNLVRRQIMKRSPGILVGGGKSGWKLYKAKRIKLPKYFSKDFKTGDIVEFYEIESETKKVNISKEDIIASPIKENIGIVLIGEGMGNNKKKSEHIFTLKEYSPLTGDNIDNAVEKLRLIKKSYGEDKYKNYVISDEKDKKSFTPVWYYERVNKENNKKSYYFSPAALGKDYYYNTLSNIIKNHSKNSSEGIDSSFLPCKNQDNLCDSCNLFGVVSDISGSKLIKSGKVRFSDAVLEKEVSNEELKQLYRGSEAQTLKILSSPRPCCTEMYTHLKDGVPKIVNNWDFEWTSINKTDYYIGDRIRLNGRKFYWHHVKGLDYTTEDKNNMNISARILKGSPENDGEKSKFLFEVYFEKINELDLKRLIWILSLGGNDNTLYHKIGMGKPLGLGSNKIKVCKVLIRQLERKNGRIIYSPCETITESYSDYFNETNKERKQRIIEELFNNGEDIKKNSNNNVYESFVKIMDFKTLENLECIYPYATNKKGETTIYGWFKPAKEYKKTLPKVIGSKITLPIYKET